MPRIPDRSGWLRRLRPHVVRLGTGNLVKDGYFVCLSRAAIVKAFEFSRYAQTKVKEPFFLTATLRGICEDLIVLSFLSTLPTRDAAVKALLDDSLQEGLERQTAFFEMTRSWQPVPRCHPEERQAARAAINKI
jgi:hypothetical protein